MKHFPFLLSIPLLALGLLDRADSQSLVCDVTCAPNSGSSGYAGAAAARPKPLNARGSSSAQVAKTSTLNAAGAPPVLTVIGSQSYNYTIPILSLPGRAGMDLTLNLYYNSRIWDVDTVDGTVTFNADRDFPSYGFRLDFGFLEDATANSSMFILTEADGTKRTLVEGTDPSHPELWYSTDGSQIQYNSVGEFLRYKDGRFVQYQAFASMASMPLPTLLRPILIEDSNGNYFSISYLSGHDQLISSITDGVGRAVTFNYNTSNQLTSLSQTIHPSGTKTYVTFTWGHPYSSGYSWYSFAGLTVNAAPTADQFQAITGCTYPNGAGYRFTYGDWGVIDKIEALSAGSSPVTRSYVSLDYPLASAGALIDAPAYSHETVSPDGGSGKNSVWAYAVTKNGTGVVTSMDVTDPNGNITTTNLDPSTGLVSSAQIKDSSGTVQRHLDYTWTTTGAPASTVISSVVTTLSDSGQQSKISYAYDAYSNVTDLYEYDYGLNLTRHTVASYLTTGIYLNYHIVDLPTQVLVEDAGGNTVSRTDFSYDGTALTLVSGAANHDDVRSDSFTTRGNLTSVTRYANAAAATGSVARTFNYDTLGNQVSAQLDCCNLKTFTFSSATQYSAPDFITRGPSGGPQFTTSYTYNPDNNLVLTSTDENGQETQYTYDSMNRLTQTLLPPQNKTSVQLNTSYDDTAALPTVTQSNTANSVVSVTTTDGPGHVLQVDSKDADSLVSTVKYGYDKLWQRTQASNPFGPSDTQVNSTVKYDALGRIVQVSPPSSGSTQYQYSGNTVTVIDPAGKQRKKITDALGRLIEVDEPVPGTPVNPGSGSATISGSEQSVQVLSTPATPGTGNVTLSGTVKWDSVSSGSTGGTTNVTIGGAEQQRPAGVIAGTGNVTLSGSEQVIPATTAAATITLTGSLQSKTVLTHAATPGVGSVTISGVEGSYMDMSQCYFDANGFEQCPIVPDTGTVSVTVNGRQKIYYFGQGDTTATIASGLASSFNSDGASPVSASSSGATVYLQAKATGSGTNYSLSTSYSSQAGSFTSSASGSSLSGGTDNQYATVYDSGATTITVNGKQYGSSWSGSGTTASGIVSSLASAINNDSAAQVSAGASGGTVSLSAKSPGASGNLSLSCSSSHDSSNFSGGSFAISCASVLSGGKDAIYDSGRASITVNGHTDSASFNSSSTPANLASALATAINADTGASVTATASGATVNLTATTKGTISNYPLSAAISYDSAHFSHSSFAAAASGANLTGGWPNPNAIDSGSMTVKINSVSYTVSWGSNSTPGSIASALASVLGGDTVVTPTLSGSTIYLDPKTPGAAYSFSTAYTYDSTDFTQSSFSTANSISDYGTTSVTISGHNDSVPWAGHSTSASVAGGLAAQINTDSAALVNASASGNVITVTARTTGASTNYALASSSSFDSSHFSSGSLSNSNSGSALAGGADAVYTTVYDAGTVWIEVNGFQASTPYQQGSTSASIAGALAGQFSASGSPVTATVSGSMLTLTARQSGSVTDFSLSAGSASSQSANFSQPSFAAGASGDTLTGGTDNPPTWTSTLYSYDVLNNLTQITQGSQTRSYSYDSLSRLGTATTPESGTVTNFYTDANANSCAGDPTLVCRVKDARAITKSFTYDAINRVTGVTYSDATPAVTVQYDTASFGQDRLGKITEGSNSHTFTYDNLGRITVDSQVIDGTTYSMQYAYNLAGQLASITYPTGRVVTHAVDDLGRLKSVSDGSATYLNALTYNAAGQTLGLTLGNQVQGTFTYNDHLQIASLRYAQSGSANNILDLVYDYGTGNNGQIQSVRYYTAPGEQNEDTTKSEYFGYDALGRLSAAHTGKVDSTAGTWGLSWAYDRWGNRLSQTLTGGNVSIGQPQFTVDAATNHITNPGYSYDAAGNVTSDGVNPYSYDGANRLKQIGSGSATYTYFGALRIKKVVGANATTYIYAGTKPVVEYVNGSVSKEYIYAGSQLLATVSGSTTTYHHPDHLSNRAETDANGNPVRTFGHFPFGETWYETGTADKFKFTSYEQDPESGLNYAQFRYQSSGAARFMGADPIAGSLLLPQSLNRYSYAMNDPVNLVDPSGGNWLTAALNAIWGWLNEERDDEGAFIGGGAMGTPVYGLMAGPAADGGGGFIGPPVPLDCILNVRVNNVNNLPDDRLQELENQVNDLFAPASVAVNFVGGGNEKVDLTLTLADPGFSKYSSGHEPDFGHAKPLSNEVTVHTGQIADQFRTLSYGVQDRAMGTTTAHEMFHALMGWEDIPYDQRDADYDIMATHGNPYLMQDWRSNLLKLTQHEMKRLLEDCLSRHPKK